MCNHNKIYSQTMLMSYPPQQLWICSKCGEKGTDIIGKVEENKYDEIIKQFNSQ